MDCTCIPYTHVPWSSTLLVDYLYHYEHLAGFYSGSPFDPKAYRTLASRMPRQSQVRRELTEILNRQNQVFGADAPTFQNIERLADPHTLAVVTGQQVGFFSGPAFTLYKALTAVRLAQSLGEQGFATVPVFWLATEDHDLEEVAEAATFNEEYELVTLRDSGRRPAPRCCVGRAELSDDVSLALNLLKSTLPPGEPRDRLLADLHACYQPGVTWSHAFGCLMARLFSRWGVVLLDPLDASVQRLVARVYERALTHAPALRQHLLERSRALVRAGYHAQVRVTEESTLIFATQDGNRVPLTQRHGEFFLDDRDKASLAELEGRARERPRDLSPNVLLRPIVQDTLLPTLVYVAGPSELAYLGQAHAIYEEFGRPMPVVFPRAGFTLVDRRVQRLLEKYGLTIEDAWQGEEHVGGKVAEGAFAQGWSERFEQTERELTQLLERLRRDIESLDPTLLDALRHTEEKMKYQMERLRSKTSRAALQRSELLRRHEQSILRFLTPREGLQEREVSGVCFLGRAGYELLDRILNQIQTRSSDHQVLVY